MPTAPIGNKHKLKKGDGLYGIQELPDKAPDKSKPWAIVNLETGDINGRWHMDKKSATDQLHAIYANMGDKAKKMSDTIRPYLHSVKEFSQWVSDNKKWVQFYPYDTWTHPIFSDTTIDPTIAGEMVKNFNAGVIGRDLATEYDHGLDKAKGGKAAGKVVKVTTVDKPGTPLGDGVIADKTGLWGLVEFNDVAKQEIDNGEWLYWSASHYDEWTHPQTGEVHHNVLENPSLTNRPYVRGMVPLNHSDIVLDPVQVEQHKDELTPETLKWIREQMDLGSSGTVVTEVIVTNNNEGGEEVNPDEILAALRSKLGLGDDIDLVAHIEDMNSELGPLRELKKEHSEAKKFSELYPEQAAELELARKERKENFAKRFSDSYADARVTNKIGTGDDAKDEPTTLGFSALVLEKIGELAKSFSDSSATPEGFKDVLDTIVGGGIVDYGTKGSSRVKDEDLSDTVDVNRASIQEVRKAFSDKITEIQDADSLDFDAAYAQAAVKFPELFEAYKGRKPTTSSVA